MDVFRYQGARTASAISLGGVMNVSAEIGSGVWQKAVGLRTARPADTIAREGALIWNRYPSQSATAARAGSEERLDLVGDLVHYLLWTHGQTSGSFEIPLTDHPDQLRAMHSDVSPGSFPRDPIYNGVW